MATIDQEKILPIQVFSLSMAIKIRCIAFPVDYIIVWFLGEAIGRFCLSASVRWIAETCVDTQGLQSHSGRRIRTRDGLVTAYRMYQSSSSVVRTWSLGAR